MGGLQTRHGNDSSQISKCQLERPHTNGAAVPFAKQNRETDCKADRIALGKVGSPIG